MSESVRFILLPEDGPALDVVEAELRALGRELRPGLEPPSSRFDARSGRVTCVGAVSKEEDVVAAVLVAAHGGGVLADARNADSTTLARLYDDLSRIAPVEIRRGGSNLDQEQLKVLGLLAEGRSLKEVAQAIGYSQRTVSRRLNAACRALEARSTAEALTRFRSPR